MIVDVAVEDLEPRARRWETELVRIPRRFGQIGHHDNVAADALQPAVKRNDPVEIVYVENADRISVQRRLPPAQPDHVLGKSAIVDHCPIGARLQTGPKDQVRPGRVVTPLLVLEELLAHKYLRNSWCGHQQRHGHPCPAARVPRAPVGPIGQSGNPRTVADLDDVVVLDARDSLPAMRKARWIELLCDRIEVDLRSLAGGGLGDRPANRFA